MTALKDMIQAAIDAGLTVREIITEPDGSCRVLTDARVDAPILDPLGEARTRRAAKGDRHVDRHKKAG